MTSHPIVPVAVLVVIGGLLIASQLAVLNRTIVRNRKSAIWRWGAVTVAAVLLLLAAVRISWSSASQNTPLPAGEAEPNIFLIVDRSPDMAVADAESRPRMELVRRDIDALIDRYPQARFAVIGFASHPALDWPLSSDVWSLRPVLDSIDPYPYSRDSAAATNAGAADVVLRYQVINAVSQYPHAQNLLFYFGAGAPESTLPPRKFDLPEGAIDGGAVLGYGTSVGGPIPGTDVERSPLDAGVLKSIAAELKIPYVSRSETKSFASTMHEDSPPPRSRRDVPSRQAYETYWAPAAGAAVLILVELYFVLRDLRRSRQVEVELP